MESMNDGVFYMKIYGNLTALFCSVTNELTAHSHMRITMQNPALLYLFFRELATLERPVCVLCLKSLAGQHETILIIR